MQNNHKSKAINLLNFVEIILLCFAIICLPLVKFEGLYNTIVVSKSIFLFIVLGILLGVLIIKIIVIQHNYKLNVSRLDVSLFVLIVYVVINRFLIQSDYVFSIRFIELIELIALYIILKCLKKEFWYYLLIAVMISGSLQAVYGNLQLLGVFSSNHSKFNITGSFFNPGPYAGFLALIGILSTGAYFYRNEIVVSLFNSKKLRLLNTLKYIAIISLGSIVLVLPATQSRASWLALITGFLLIVGYKYDIFNVLKKHKFTTYTLGILLLGISGYFLYVFKQDSANGRLLIWKVSKGMILENPIFGVGFDRFQTFYMELQANYFEKNILESEALLASNNKYAFNELIQLIAEQGIVGLLLLLVVVFFVYKVKHTDYVSLICKMALVGLFVFGMFSYPMHILPIKIVLVVMLVSLSKSLNTIDIFPKSFAAFWRSNLLLKVTLVLGIIMIVVFGSLFINKLNNSYKTWANASESYNYGFYKESADDYRVANHFLSKNGYFQLQYGQTLYHLGRNRESLEFIKSSLRHVSNSTSYIVLGDCYRRGEAFTNAENAYLQAYYMTPSRLYPQYLLAQIYKENNQREKLKVLAKKVINQKIKVPSPAIYKIKEEMRFMLE